MVGKSSTIPASLNTVVVVLLPVLIALSAALALTVLSFHRREQATEMPTMGGHDLTFPHAHPHRAESAWRLGVGLLKPPTFTPPVMRSDLSVCG